jgi:hypothetical protein
MSATPIGYIETVREDLLDAAWRSTMRSAVGTRRRRPSLRWVVAGATVVTLLAAGIVGSLVLSNGRPMLENQSRALGGPSRHLAVPSSAPSVAPEDLPAAGFGDAQSGTAKAAGNDGAAGDQVMPGGALSIPDTGAINPVGNLSKVIKTARLSIVVERGAFGDRFTQVGDIADRLDGYISSSSTSGARSGFVTLRVPARRFQEALRSLRALGRVDGEDVLGRDVTAEYVDLTARLRIARARRSVLFALMKKAVSIEQTIRVQNALDDVQLRIEELQGQINVLNDRVSQATIRVSMRETGVKAHGETNVENPSIPGAFDRAIAGFFSVIAAVIVGLGWIVPALVVLAAVWFVVTRVRRRLA